MASILVVDADAEVRAFLRTSLGGEYYVREAENTAQAIQLYHQAPADLVLCDLFPGESGDSTLAQLRRHFPAVKALSVSDSQNGADTKSLALRQVSKATRLAGLLRIVHEVVKAASS